MAKESILFVRQAAFRPSWFFCKAYEDNNIPAILI